MTGTSRARNLTRFGALVVLGWLLLYVVVGQGFREGVRSSDWPDVMIMSRLVTGDPGHLYARDAQRQMQLTLLGPGGYFQAGQPVGLLGLVSPPWVGALGVPFAALGLVWGGVAWTLTEFAALLGGMALLARRWWDALLAAAGVPFWVLLANANLDGLVVLGLGLAWFLRARPFWAGAALGLTLVKPHLVLLLPLVLLIEGRWTILFGWAAAGLFLVGMDELIHPGLTLDWVRAAVSQAGRIGRDLTPAGIGYQLGAPAGWALTLVGAAAALLLSRRRRPALLAGTLLAAPHGLISDLTLVSAGIAMARLSRPLELGVLSAGALVLVLASRHPLLVALVGTALLLGFTYRLGRHGEDGEPGSAPGEAGQRAQG